MINILGGLILTVIGVLIFVQNQSEPDEGINQQARAFSSYVNAGLSFVAGILLVLYELLK